VSAPWEVSSYTDEAGFRRRTAPMIPLLAARDVGKKCLAVSVCPDTRKTVRTWALVGEEIVSPYTGRRYKQGDTGYFGPKQRDSQGRISAFGGDPLKQDLPPAIARLLLGQDDDALRAFLTIPGTLRQHYHFAAANWCRLWPLVGKKLGPEWERAFREAIAVYSESRRPSDGARENLPLPRPHDLVGMVGELLGGPVEAGGTENHKTMWRCSGLLYAQWFPENKISGYPAPEASRRITTMLQGFLQTILTVGNGEYDSSTYYPHSLRSYLNLYDFSPDPKTRLLAKAMLDYYLAGYGLKMLGGLHAGAIKRGWPGDGTLLSGDGMDAHAWAWVPDTPIPVDPKLITSIQQATTTYRPNRVICNLIRKRVPLPFEAQIARPSYHSKERNVFQETFYCSSGFALGSVAMTQIDNPTQQTVWSLVCKDERGMLVFGGGQPKFRHPEGHSPYDQTIQKRGTLILRTGPNQSPGVEPLAPKDAETWLFVPRRTTKSLERNGVLFFEAGEALVAVHPQGKGYSWREPTDEKLKDYRVLIVPLAPDSYGGYTLEAVERKTYGSLERFASAVLAETETTAHGPLVRYRALTGDTLELRYQPKALRAMGSLNGEEIHWEGWAKGGVYDSPYLTIKDGIMTLSDGKERYTLGYEGEELQWH